MIYRPHFVTHLGEMLEYLWRRKKSAACLACFSSQSSSSNTPAGVVETSMESMHFQPFEAMARPIYRPLEPPAEPDEPEEPEPSAVPADPAIPSRLAGLPSVNETPSVYAVAQFEFECGRGSFCAHAHSVKGLPVVVRICTGQDPRIPLQVFARVAGDLGLRPRFGTRSSRSSRISA